MNWIGPAVCFLIWIGSGVYAAMNIGALQKIIGGMSRGKKMFFALGGLFVGLAILFGGLVMVSAIGGTQNGHIKVWAWPIILIVGLIFIGFQVFGAAALWSIQTTKETTSRNGSS